MSWETMLIIGLGAIALLGWAAIQVGRLVFVRTVPPGSALLVTPKSGPRLVSFSSALVVPHFHHATLIDISVKLLKIDRSVKNPLLSKDAAVLRGRFTFCVRVSKTEDGVMRVAQTFSEHPVGEGTLRELFVPKFDEGLDTAAAGMTGAEILQRRQIFKDEVLKIIGTDLNGYTLDDLAIDELVRRET